MYILPKPAFIDYGGGTLPLKGKSPEELISTVFIDKNADNPESYRLKITERSIAISAGSEIGVFRAKTTLRQLALSHLDCLPTVEIIDAPRFSYRGFMIDSARHMQSVDELKKMIDSASLFKFNRFHWHLADDQGFRIQLEKHPEITEKGCVRNASTFNKNDIRNEPYGGFYIKAELLEIVRYCHERYIEVIPELDVPGHVTALLHARPDLSCTGKELQVKTCGGVFRDILCAGNDDTYAVIRDILDELCDIFTDPMIHLGGDEAPKSRWNSCPKCQEKIRSLGLQNAEELQGYFVNYFSDYLKTKNKRTVVWNESLNGGNLCPDTTAQYWMDKTGVSAKWANDGNALILSPFKPYYADYPYGMYSLKAVYAYEPTGLKNLSETGKRRIIGIESPIWTEYVTNLEKMAYLCFPRYMAVAETGWSSPQLKNYRDFERRAEFFCGVLAGKGLKAAPKTDWNPSPLERVSKTVQFFSGVVSVENIRNLLNPDRERNDE